VSASRILPDHPRSLAGCRDWPRGEKNQDYGAGKEKLGPKRVSSWDDKRMKRPQTLSRSRLLGFTVVVLALSVNQGCSLTGIDNSGLQNWPDPVLESSGATLRPDYTPDVYIGAASWYGPGFNGKKTASGEIFDETKLTAAHKTIPLGRRARVTHLGNGKSVEVLINDRGPYVEGRMIDLSHAAAKVLGMIDDGIAKVQVELLREAGVAENVQSLNRR